MAAPDPSFIIATPPPLNPVTPWPFAIDEFQADTIFGVLGQEAPPGAAIAPAQANPLRLQD